MTSHASVAARPPARRNIVKGAAWVVPAVTVAAAAPAAAASPSCVAPVPASVCRSTVAFVVARYDFSVDLQNSCASSVTVQATVTAQTSGGAESTGQVTRTLAAGATTRITGTYTRLLNWDAFPTSITVSYSVGGVAASQTFSSPWDCTAAPTGAGGQATQGRSSERVPSDQEIRAHLEANPELMEQKQVQDLLREHPEWDPRTSARAEPTSTPEPASAPTTRSVAPEQPAVDAEQPSGDAQETSGDAGSASDS